MRFQDEYICMYEYFKENSMQFTRIEKQLPTIFQKQKIILENARKWECSL